MFEKLIANWKLSHVPENIRTPTKLWGAWRLSKHYVTTNDPKELKHYQYKVPYASRWDLIFGRKSTRNKHYGEFNPLEWLFLKVSFFYFKLRFGATFDVMYGFYEGWEGHKMEMDDTSYMCAHGISHRIAFGGVGTETAFDLVRQTNKYLIRYEKDGTLDEQKYKEYSTQHHFTLSGEDI